MTGRNSAIVDYYTSSDEEDEVPVEPTAKRVKLRWQEALVSLMAAQQEQIAQLVRNSNMATGPTPNVTPAQAGTAPAHASTSSTTTSFRLAEFNPETTNHPIEEWLDVATKIKKELFVSDTVMIAKAGESLKGRAHQYYIDWRPVKRTWEEFCADLIVAFPDRETPGARAYTAATLRSRDCVSLSDYGIQKLRAIHRFHQHLPWDTTLSMIEYGLDHSKVQAAIRIQRPDDKREVLKLLTEFDGRLRKHRAIPNVRSHSSVDNPNTQKRRLNTPNPIFSGTCFGCGRNGHRQADCKSGPKSKEEPRKRTPERTELRREEGPPVCSHCKRPGHTEETCWQKHGKPKKKVLLIRRGRELTSTR